MAGRVLERGKKSRDARHSLRTPHCPTFGGQHAVQHLLPGNLGRWTDRVLPARGVGASGGTICRLGNANDTRDSSACEGSHQERDRSAAKGANESKTKPKKESATLLEAANPPFAANPFCLETPGNIKKTPGNSWKHLETQRKQLERPGCFKWQRQNLQPTRTLLTVTDQLAMDRVSGIKE